MNNKKIVNSIRLPWISLFSLKFYILFIFVSLLGNFIIDFNSIEFLTWGMIIIYVTNFCIGTTIGCVYVPKISMKKVRLSPIFVLKILFGLSLPSVILGWYYMINHYGSIDYIIQYAMTIRNETIGDGEQIIPTIVSYLSSFLFTGLAVSLSLHYHTKQKKMIYFIIFFLIFIVLEDLLSFGRIGMLFAIFMLISYILLFKIKVKYGKIAFPSIIIYCFFMLPRYIRGGGSIEGISDNYAPYLKIGIPVLFSSLISIYCYYFSGLYAFNELVLHFEGHFALGTRNFASLINLANRLFPLGLENRISIIADFVSVPFETNIYTVLGELYMDFGLLGIFLFPILFGLSIGFFFQYKGVFADALKLVFIVWIFYTPIYNMFSFGAFLLAYITLAFLVLFANEKNINCYR